MTTINQEKLSKEIKEKYSIVNNSFTFKPKDDPKDRIETEIGDVKQADFYPQVKVKRWDNEVNLSYRLIDNEKGTPTITTESDKVIWEKGNIKSHFYEIPACEEHPEGAYEFDIWLKEKPKTNKIEFSLNTKGVEFYYQPELTKEEKDGGCFRPERVVGSYVVYASENKINYVGGKEYKTGQVGFIYRPKIIDSAGAEVWGILDIKDGVLSVEIPQDFLDKATYPIKHASGTNFGYETKGGSTQQLFTGRLYGSIGSGGTGTLDSITAYYIKLVDYAPSLQCGLYIYGSDTKGQFVANSYTEQWTITAGWDNWKTLNVASPPRTKAIDYWILMNRDNWVNVCYNNLGNGGISQLSVTYGTWPALSGSATSFRYSVYGTYTPSAWSQILPPNHLRPAIFSPGNAR